MTLSKGAVNRSGELMSKWWIGELGDEDLDLIEHVGVIGEWREQHAYPLALCMPGLRNWVERAGGPTRPAQRLKQMQTIIEKLVRHPGMKLARMQDIAGCRAVLADRRQVDEVAARIQDRWHVARVADYRQSGRPDTGYRALHVMVVKRERVVEIQLRTETEHDWAEIVASTGSRLGYPLKDGVGPPDLIEYFRMASHMLRLRDLGEPADIEDAVRFRELRKAVRPYFTK